MSMKLGAEEELAREVANQRELSMRVGAVMLGYNVMKNGVVVDGAGKNVEVVNGAFNTRFGFVNRLAVVWVAFNIGEEIRPFDRFRLRNLELEDDVLYGADNIEKFDCREVSEEKIRIEMLDGKAKMGEQRRRNFAKQYRERNLIDDDDWIVFDEKMKGKKKRKYVVKIDQENEAARIDVVLERNGGKVSDVREMSVVANSEGEMKNGEMKNDVVKSGVEDKSSYKMDKYKLWMLERANVWREGAPVRSGDRMDYYHRTFGYGNPPVIWDTYPPILYKPVIDLGIEAFVQKSGYRRRSELITAPNYDAGMELV